MCVNWRILSAIQRAFSNQDWYGETKKKISENYYCDETFPNVYSRPRVAVDSKSEENGVGFYVIGKQKKGKLFRTNILDPVVVRTPVNSDLEIRLETIIRNYLLLRK